MQDDPLYVWQVAEVPPLEGADRRPLGRRDRGVAEIAPSASTYQSPNSCVGRQARIARKGQDGDSSRSVWEGGWCGRHIRWFRHRQGLDRRRAVAGEAHVAGAEQRVGGLAVGPWS